MKVLALISGGKDSCYSILQCVAAGHEIVALANLYPPSGVEELDSFMYQSVGCDLIPYYAEAIGLPLFRKEIRGITLATSKDYQPVEGDEVEDLYELVQEARSHIQFDAVAAGAILSDYQRIRVENVCSRLNLTSLAYLWKRNQEELLQEMIDAGIQAIIIKVACLGLDPEKHLGKELKEIQPHLHKMKDKYGINVCGEGGEYETFTLDCPLFESCIVIDEARNVVHSADAFAPVAFLRIESAHLMKKAGEINKKSFIEKLANVKVPGDFLMLEKCPPEKVDTEADEVKLKTPFNVDMKVIVTQLEDGLFEINGLMGNNNCVTDSVKSVMEKLTEILKAHDLTLDDLILVNVYINKMKEYRRFNREFKKYFTINPPARACVEVDLGSRADFYMNCKATKKVKRALHVQSVSHWAPANIGPYSQAVQMDRWIFTAGQIALIPGSMELLNATCLSQSHLIFNHIDRVLTAVDQDCNFKNVVSGICFLRTDSFEVEAIKAKFSNSVEREILVSFVVVDDLPRHADVEWQVVAHLEPEKWIFSSNTMNLKSYSVQIQTMEHEKERLMGFLMKKLFQADRDELMEVLKLIIDKLGDGLKIRTVTIFLQRKINLNVQILYEFFILLNASVSMIPVKNLESNGLMLVLMNIEK